MTRDGTVGRFRRNRAKPDVSSGHRSRLNDEDSVRGPHQGQQSTRTASTGRTHDCKRPLRCTPNDLLPGGGHPHMRRREFITLLGGTAAWPLAARAQQPAMPVIGFLDHRSPETVEDRLRGFRQGLKDTGYVEGDNVTIVYRWGEYQFDRLPELAAQLVRRQVAVIVPSGSVAAPLAAKAATTTIPIVFGVPEDPVRLGLVSSLARPGGNLTGVNFFSGELTAKRLELLRELVPGAAHVAVLVNPANAANTETTLKDVQSAARAMRLQIQIFNASTSREVDAAFASFGRERPDALFVGQDGFFNSRRL